MTSAHPFRFGVFAESVRSPSALLEIARRAEGEGFSTFLMRDHFIAEHFGDQMAPLATLATVAAVTKELRIGSLVFCNDYRHPVMLAKEVATLDVLSEGRFELGLGAGFSRREYEQAGLEFDGARVRVQRLGETVQILKGLFLAEPFDFTGEHYRVRDLRSFPTPVQRPHPPILVAGTSTRMLSLAAAEADILGFQTVATATGAVVQDPRFRMAETVQQKLDQLKQAAGERFGKIELSMTASLIVSDDRRGEAERFARARAWAGVSADEVLEMPSVFIGSVETIIDEMRARRESYGFSYFVIHDRALADAAPVVARLAGK